MDYSGRLSALQQNLLESGWAAAIISHSRDIYYYTGTAQPGHLFVLPDDYFYFGLSGFDLACRQCALPESKMAAERHFGKMTGLMLKGLGKGGKVAIQSQKLSASQAGSMARHLRGFELTDCTDLIFQQKTVKDAEEISCISQACQVSHAGCLAAREFLKPGVSELELAAVIEHAHRVSGHEGMFFLTKTDVCMSSGPVASGPNINRVSGVLFALTGCGLSAAVPAGPSRRIIERDDLVLVDIPTCVQGYHCDQTRMYCAGEPSPAARELFACLRGISDGLVRGLRPGMTCDQAYRLAMERADALGVKDHFLKFPSGERAHFVGHGLGLEIGEPPLLAKGNPAPLKANTVTTLEMHLMRPDGLTVKLEDTVLLEKGGCRMLSQSPREIICAD